MLNNKSILITGGTGSFGKKFVSRIISKYNKIHEAADVLYHLVVYLEANGVKIEDVMEELNKRKK